MYHFHGLEDTIISMSILLKLPYRFNAVPIKIPAVFFPKTNKLILQFIWRRKGKAIFVKKTTIKNKIGELTVSDTRAIVSTGVYTVWCWYRDKRTNGTEQSPGTSPHPTGTQRAVQCERDDLFGEQFWVTRIGCISSLDPCHSFLCCC